MEKIEKSGGISRDEAFVKKRTSMTEGMEPQFHLVSERGEHVEKKKEERIKSKTNSDELPLWKKYSLQKKYINSQ